MTETVFELFEAAALRVPEGGCLGAPPMTGRPYHPEGVEIGYREARERVAALSALYRAAGYGRGHRVALLLENRPDFHLNWWALNALGCGIVPINPAYRRDEMVYLLDHSEAALVVYGRGHRVALLLENRPDFHLNWWALNALGCGCRSIRPTGGTRWSISSTIRRRPWWSRCRSGWPMSRLRCAT